MLGKIIVPSSEQGGFDNPNAFVPVLTPRYVTFTLDRKVPVKAGEIYHIVMRNLRPPIKCPRGGGTRSRRRRTATVTAAPRASTATSLEGRTKFHHCLRGRTTAS